MSGVSGESGRGAKVITAAMVTVGVIAGGFALKQAGLLAQIGTVPTYLLIGADAFVVVLMWVRAMRG